MRQVIVIGLDGLSWNVLDKLIERKAISNMTFLRNKMAYGRCKSVFPYLTTSAWTSLATGVNPGKHGIYSFMMHLADGSSKLVASQDVMYPRIYEMTSMKELTNVVINLPLSYPPSPAFKGIMVSDWLYPHFEVYPRSASSLIEDYIFPVPGHTWLNPVPKHFLEEILTHVKHNISCIKRLFSKLNWNMFFVVFSETDWLLHHMYDEVMLGTELSGEVDKIFTEIDNFIGWFTKHMGSEALLLIVSDHGFTKYDYLINVNNALLDAGLTKLTVVDDKESQHDFTEYLSPNARARKKLIRIPKFLVKVLKDIQLIQNIAEKVLPLILGRYTLSFHQDVDRRFSRAFSFANDSGVYINSKNEKAEITKKLIEKCLFRIKEPGTSKPVFERICPREDLFSGPYLKNIPDILLMPREGYEVHHKSKGEILEKVHLSGHASEGLLIAYGKDVTRIEINENSIFDIVPTVLHYLGLPIPLDSDGNVLFSMFDVNSDVRKRPVRKENYLERWLLIRRNHHTKRTEEKMIKKRLKSLGYL